MLSSKNLGFNKTSSLACRQGRCYNNIRGTRQLRIIPNGNCGIDHVMRHDLGGAPVPLNFRIHSHSGRFLQAGESFFRIPWFIIVKNGIGEKSELSGNSAAGGFFGFTSFPQMVIKISDDRIKKARSGGSDEESHFERFIALDGHFESGLYFAGFPYDGIESDITDKLFRSFKSFDIADFGNDGCYRNGSEPGDRVETMIRKRRVERGDNILVESFDLRKQLNEPLGSPLDNERSPVRQGFDGSSLGEFDEAGGKFRPDFMSKGDREIAEFGFSYSDDFVGGRYQGKSDKHFHRDFCTQKKFVAVEMNTKKTPKPVFDFGGFFLERPSDAGKLFECLLSGQIRKGGFGGYLREIESNHVSVKFIGFVNLKMHFLKLLDGKRINDMNFNFAGTGGIKNRSKVFVEVGSGFHSGNDFCSCSEQRTGGGDCSFKVANSVRGIGKNNVRPNGLALNISESDVKFSFGDVDTDKKFFHGIPPEKIQTNGRMRQRGSSQIPARLSLLNCAVMPQDIIKAQSRGMRRHPPARGRTTIKMKAYSSSPRYKIYQNKKNKVGRPNLDTWIANA